MARRSSASTTCATTSKRSRPRGRSREDRAPLKIELTGLELHGFHGVLEEEERDGQLFRFDVLVELAEPAADDIDAAVDYRHLAACVREISDGTRFQLLETLAAAIAEELRRRFPVERVVVRVGKPGVELEGGRATVVAER